MSAGTAEYIEALAGFVRRLEQAPHGTKGDILKDACGFFGFKNHHKFYREVERMGLKKSKRKTRSDAGTTTQDEQSLDVLAATIRVARRSNGKQMGEVPNMRSMLAANGFKFTSNSNLNRLLRERNMHVDAMKRAQPTQQVRSAYPNHIHQIDPSLCVIYYDPETKAVKGVKHFQNVADESAFYKNKPEAFTKAERLRVWRYVLTDHASGYICVKYYAAKGETMANLADFQLWCWHKNDDIPLHGCPTFCLVDPGTANGAGPIKLLCKGLKIKLIQHKPGAANAKGQVECANNLVEKLFESRLLFEPVKSVDEMNAAVVAWQNAYNANLIPEYDSTHTRHGQSRFDVWALIHTAQFNQHLRILPPLEICKYLMTYKPEQRKVRNYVITYKHPAAPKSQEYSLVGCDHVINDQYVNVSPIILGNSLNILIYTKDPVTRKEVAQEVEPIIKDQFGFDTSLTEFGEGYNGVPDDAISASQKRALTTAYPNLSLEDAERAAKKKDVPFSGQINAHTHLKSITQTTPFAAKGTDVEVPAVFKEPVEKPLSRLKAKEAIAKALGRSLNAVDSEFISSYDQILPSQISNLVEQIRSGEHTPDNNVTVVKFGS